MQLSLVRIKIRIFPLRVLICSLKYFDIILLQCYSAWRGQVCPYGQRPHDHGEDSQREEGHCAGVRPWSGNPRYVKNGRMLWKCYVSGYFWWCTDCTLTGMMYGFVLITKEHRSLLETAYAYGSKHQFVLITGGPVLKYLG